MLYAVLVAQPYSLALIAGQPSIEELDSFIISFAGRVY